ncbi:MAG: CTP synthase [Candidatus Paceibacterota bacterium]
MSKKNHKYIFVIGGVMSGVGKGIAVSSVGNILQAKGYKVNLVKIDPYLNVDAGTMNPTEHGETFVLASGLECDQDMGNYERFLSKELSPHSYITSGMVYKYVIDKERNLGYKGKCVEAIPHIREEILRRIKKSIGVNGSEVSVIEIGGTIGDYQNAMFVEAARVLKLENPKDVVFIMVSYLPIPGKLGEMKTRPTQNAIRALNSYGVQPDFIIARSSAPLDKQRKEKIATACNIKPSYVISAPDIESIYDVPLNFEKDNIGTMILEALSLDKGKNRGDMRSWRNFVTKIKKVKKEINIAIVGKYFETGDFVLADAYLSVIEAIKYSSYHAGRKPVVHWLSSDVYEKDAKKLKELQKYDGIIIPGGFGSRGVEGKIAVAGYARKNKIPYFGLCYGMHMMVIEYARNVARLKGAHTIEVDPKTSHPVIDILPEQKENLKRTNYGGTMRLGVYRANLKKNTLAQKVYGSGSINERHRHRYEVNPEYVTRLEEAGLVFSGASPNNLLMEIAELPEREHPFYLATQFHPEFTARPLAPHPLYNAFIKASVKRSERKKKA